MHLLTEGLSIVGKVPVNFCSDRNNIVGVVFGIILITR